ncbi:hypothetical protein NKI15_31655 [Mesorhizobium sp. M0862]|uniref:hypothetical protein n=1 Tax=Mesorhizobium sp. M0862 TaxID=2957015 RepID=UPI00333801FE
MPSADSTVSAAVITPPVAVDRPVRAAVMTVAAKFEIVAASWVPVWVERSRKLASVALAVAADAIPASFVFSVAV